MGARGIFRFAEYALADGCWPPSLAPILIPILITIMIGSQETECKGLHAVDFSISSHSGEVKTHNPSKTEGVRHPKGPSVQCGRVCHPRCARFIGIGEIL